MKSAKKNRFLYNNENLPVDVDVQWTQELLEEYKKCYNDIFYFAEKYFFIVTEEGRHPIKLYPAQKDAIKDIMDNKKTIVCASRQVGKTTLMTVVCMWLALFSRRSDYRIAILANKEDQAKEILERMKLAYEEIPNYLKSGVVDFTKEKVKLKNGAEIFVSTTSGDAIRGKTVDLLFVDEFAHVRKEIAEPFFKSVIPTLSSRKSAKLVLISTPNSTDNKYYEIYSQAERGYDIKTKKPSGWKAVRIHWSQVPGRDENWVKEQQEAIGHDMDLWNQEFELKFLEQGSSSLNADVIEKLKLGCSLPKFNKFPGLWDDEYRVWKEPVPGNIYVFGIDSAEGVGKDNSVCQILDITDLTNIEQVAKFSSNRLIPVLFAEKVFEILQMWGRPFLCIESNKEGSLVLNELLNVYKYDNIVHYNMENDKLGYYQKPGIFCHSNSKSEGITNLKYWVEHLQVVKLNDMETVKEFETFVRRDNKTWGAKKGYNDDHYMALLWGLLLLTNKLANKYLDVIETNDIGKPSIIRDPNADLALDAFYSPRKTQSLNRSDNDPMPTIFQFGYNNSMQSEVTDTVAAYLSNGWRLCY
jgi:Terminase large subunit, T4likevirus-type, N-terminal/Terminase RNaseH-like domain